MTFESMRKSLCDYVNKEIDGIIDVVDAYNPEYQYLAIQFTGDNMPDIIRIIDYASNLVINGIGYVHEEKSFTIYFEDRDTPNLEEYYWFIWRGETAEEKKMSKRKTSNWTISKTNHFDKHWLPAKPVGAL